MLGVLEYLRGSFLGALGRQPFAHQDLSQLRGLFLRPLGNLASLEIDLTKQEIALARDRCVLTDGHRAGPRDEPRDAGEEQRVSVGAGARHAEHE